MYHLVYHRGWSCVFVSGECLKILECSRDHFLDVLRQIAIFEEESKKETSIDTILKNLARSAKKQSYAGIIRRENGGLRHIKASFVSVHENGQISLYGQISDVTAQREHTRIQSLERSGLLQIAQITFPEILSMNLTKGTYHIIQYDDATTIGTPQEGSLMQMLLSRLEHVASEDRRSFENQFFPEEQLRAFRSGQKRLQLTYRRCGTDNVWRWMETIMILQENPYSEDVLSFAVSRSVDQQKKQEELLKQALLDSTEKLEDWLYYNRLTNQVFPGLIYIHYEDGRPSPYTVGSLTKRLNCSPRKLALSTCPHIPKEDQGAVQAACSEAKARGENSFRAEYRVVTDNGETIWIYNHAVHFEDKDGGRGHIHFLTETTHEHVLMDQLRLYMEDKLLENEKIFNIVSLHSDRTLCYYDFKTRRIRPWNEDDCEVCEIIHICFKKFSFEQFAQREAILPDSRETAKRMVREIHEGVPFGKANIHIAMPDGSRRWLQFKYSGLLDGETPVAALISYKDVTDRQKRELAYRRHIQASIFNSDDCLLYIESDLTTDQIEKISGQISLPDFQDIPYSELGDRLQSAGFHFEKKEDASLYFSCANLQMLFEKGRQRLNSRWQVRFQDGALHWLDANITFTVDPYSGNIKAIFRISDITKELEKEQSLLKRADYDTMTGLLRRGTGEIRIREYLSDHSAPGGILVALDLDDLKGINDTLGHKQGDAAIIGVAETLKSHFRKDDILIRAGGDEFLVFLPGAGKSVDSMKLSLSNLLLKLSSISVGDGGGRTLHCSIGCAVELSDTDTFESLYYRADIALYHVKRNGKNNFAFFEPGMLEDNYRFQAEQAFPITSGGADAKELQVLLKIISAYFSSIVLFNLTQNYFHILTINETVKNNYESDRTRIFWKNWRENIHPDDRKNTFSIISRDGLLSLHARGLHHFCHSYRELQSSDYIEMELLIHLYTADNGDVCTFLFFRPDAAFEKDLLS